MAIHRRVLDCFAALAMTVMLMLPSPAAAQTFPELTGRVVDQANLLSPEQEQDLSRRSAALEQQTGAQFVVATVNSLEDRTIEDYGYQLGRDWGIGREGEDDGVILLVAPNERKVRIETGYGAEGVLPDILAGRIIRNDILPRFREGNMAGGIIAGADAILGQLSLPPDQARENVAEAQAAEAAQAQERPGFIPVMIIAGMMIFVFTMLAAARRAHGMRYRSRGRRGRRRGGMDAGDVAVILWGLSALSSGRGGWGGGGGFGGGGFGGGGFGGFSGGGGSFGGGGASGGW